MRDPPPPFYFFLLDRGAAHFRPFSLDVFSEAAFSLSSFLGGASHSLVSRIKTMQDLIGPNYPPPPPSLRLCEWHFEGWEQSFSAPFLSLLSFCTCADPSRDPPAMFLAGSSFLIVGVGPPLRGGFPSLAVRYLTCLFGPIFLASPSAPARYSTTFHSRAIEKGPIGRQ